MSAVAATFLAGAGSRLLPASIPFRFFGAAVVFHVIAWLAAMAGADGLPAFAGGLGWPLASLHAVTLGVLAMTAIGASLQLFPVATRRPIVHAGLAAGVFWGYVPGVALVVAGMGIPSPTLLGAGAIAVACALVVFVVLFALNLSGARGMPLVVAHGTVAAISLAATLATALAVVAAYTIGTPVDRATMVELHLALAGYGFMGMLALGLSYVLVPMFALSGSPPAHRGWASFALGCAALVLAAGAAAGILPGVLGVAAAGFGAVAAILHVQLMRDATAQGLRRELGIGFRLVRIAWGALIGSLALALAIALGLPAPRLPTLFGATLVAGWLLTFVLGIMQRIVPFLASMHAARGRRRPPTPSSLTAERPLVLHFRLHVAALALLAAAIAADSGALALAAGAAGAVAYATFFAIVVRRMAASPLDAGQ
ncbi:hypothetical protein BURK1_02605 [Burkholderiales bacterium]|nr:hypothetical protein BURK1_02605 [Burkholderiales bacterium]